MLAGKPVPDKGPKHNPLFDVCMPLFDKARGYRMKIMRMKLLMDQKELGERLGVSAQVISVLETGKQAVHGKKPFTLTQFIEVFGDLTSHILLGTGEFRFNYSFIQLKYYENKLRNTRKPGSGQWRSDKYMIKKDNF